MLLLKIGRKEYCLVMSRGCFVPMALSLTLLMSLPGCEFYRDKDFIEAGASQSYLRFLVQQKASIELTESEKIINAYSDGGRDPTFWFEVSFDPNEADRIRSILIQSGYDLRKEVPARIPTEVEPFEPVPKIERWWNPTAMKNATLFTLQRDNERIDTDGVWWLLDESGGRMLGCSFTY